MRPPPNYGDPAGKNGGPTWGVDVEQRPDGPRASKIANIRAHAGRMIVNGTLR
jgi:hypothetical protein